MSKVNQVIQIKAKSENAAAKKASALEIIASHLNVAQLKKAADTLEFDPIKRRLLLDFLGGAI